MVNIASYNVRGLGNKEKRLKIFNYLRNKFYDIICLQETHSTKQIEKFWKTQWGGPVFYSHGDSRSKGCIILFRRKLDVKVHYMINDKMGRFNLMDVTIGLNRVVLCNIYAPNRDDTGFFQEVFLEIDKLSEKTNGNIIIVGDLNTSLASKDKKALMAVARGIPIAQG